VTVSTVLFDGDDTLWDFGTAMRRALAVTLDELWARRPGPWSASLTVERLIAIRDRVAGELAGRVIDLGMVRLAAFERALEEAGIPEPALASDLTASFFSHLNRHLGLFEDTVPCLDALAHLELGVVTNGTAHPDQFGIGDRFGAVVRSSEVGASKPDPAMVYEALRRLDALPGATVLVGDSPAHDVGAARAAGVIPILLDRRGEMAAASDVVAIRSLGELPGILERNGGRH